MKDLRIYKFPLVNTQQWARDRSFLPLSWDRPRAVWQVSFCGHLYLHPRSVWNHIVTLNSPVRHRCPFHTKSSRSPSSGVSLPGDLTWNTVRNAQVSTQQRWGLVFSSGKGLLPCSEPDEELRRSQWAVACRGQLFASGPLSRVWIILRRSALGFSATGDWHCCD